ncbi:hypothetical protein ARNL5_00788 [Anaerolineae bacterium]|nr:hypothetical protein [Sandaracinaceae bacterium]CAG0959322.1 hypothetical protein ARNL5_00788 [Anaerolineae bacterium]
MRLLLQSDQDRDAFDAALVELELCLLNVLPATAHRPRQLVASSAGGEDLVCFVEDHRVPARYLVILSHDPEPMAKALAAHLTTVDARALEDELARAEDPESQSMLLRLMAVAGDRAALERAARQASLSSAAASALALLDELPA